MKTLFLPLKRSLKLQNGLLLPVCALALFLQSCGTESGYLQCSIDGNQQLASGPSYPRESPNDKSYAGNVALIFLGAQEDPAAYRAHGAIDLNPAGNFYASTDLDLPSLAFSNGQKTDKPKAVKKAPDFMSHLNYMGGIELVQKRSSDGSGSSTALDYLEIPVYGLYQYQLSSGTLFGGLGPYLAYGIAGNTKSSFGGNTTSMSSFDSTSGYKRFDAGVGFTAGYRMPNSFYFNLAYELGIANIDRNAFGDKTRNRTISVNVGYPINRIIKAIKK